MDFSVFCLSLLSLPSPGRMDGTALWRLEESFSNRILFCLEGREVLCSIICVKLSPFPDLNPVRALICGSTLIDEQSFVFLFCFVLALFMHECVCMCVYVYVYVMHVLYRMYSS